MPHDVHLIATVAAGFGFAMVFGLVAAKMRMPPLVGYLLAGVVIGPFTPGFVGDLGLAAQLAEIGVMLLMFGVGLHFSIDDLLKVKGIAVPGALVQMLVAVCLGALAASAWGWSLGAGLVFGLCLSVASTVVLLRALEARGLLQSVNGRIAVGWLVVEDLVMVLVLVLIPALAGLPAGLPAAGQAGSPTDHQGALVEVLWIVGKVLAFVVVMIVGGKRLLPRALWWVAQTGSQELFRLGVTAVAIGVAFAAAKLFDVSFALGAFFAGMMLRESEFSHRAAEESLPLRDTFAVLFFVSVGMLFDPSILWREPVKLLVVVTIIVLGKTFAAMLLVLALRYPLSTALTVGAALAQIGEFSFILAGLGVGLGILPEEGRSLVLAGALVSIAIHAPLFGALEPIRLWTLERSALARRLEHRIDDLDELPPSTDRALLSGHVVVLGYGRVGRQIGAQLMGAGVAVIAADSNPAVVETLRAEGIAAVAGGDAMHEVLIQAHLSAASLLVIAVDDAVVAHRAASAARAIRPELDMLIRCHSEEEAALYARESLGAAFVPETELARRMAAQALAQLGRQPASPS